MALHMILQKFVPMPLHMKGPLGIYLNGREFPACSRFFWLLHAKLDECDIYPNKLTDVCNTF